MFRITVKGNATPSAVTFPIQLTVHNQTYQRALNGEASAQYDLGTRYHHGDGVEQDYAEAKKWKGAVGVKAVSRLISRLKHRDFGIFITTSFFGKQVQVEIIEDTHPILLIAGGDIAHLLIKQEIAGDGNHLKFKNWINSIKKITS